MNHLQFYVTRTREVLGLTQKDFAKACAVHPQTVSSWETKRRTPEPSVVEWCKGARVVFDQIPEESKEDARSILVAHGLSEMLSFLIHLTKGASNGIAKAKAKKRID